MESLKISKPRPKKKIRPGRGWARRGGAAGGKYVDILKAWSIITPRARIIEMSHPLDCGSVLSISVMTSKGKNIKCVKRVHEQERVKLPLNY